MHRVRAHRNRKPHQGVDVQVGANRFAATFGANQERFISLEAMQREPVLVTVDGHGPQPQLGAGTQAADGDLRTIGNQQLAHVPRGERALESNCIHNQGAMY